MKRVSVIGSGFSSLSAACYLAKDGFDVTVYEKNEAIGGRARQLIVDGFKFDMGPSWYWMPDVFERFFADFGRKTTDYYKLVRLSPSYKIFFDNRDHLEIPDSESALYDLFEREEEGSSTQLRDFLRRSKYNYDVAIKKLVYRPGLSPLELITPETIANISQFFSSIRSEIQKRFRSKKLRQILEFPVLFLGAKPQDTPAFYSFMNYADLILGTWYPEGGIYSVVKGLEKLARELNVKFELNANVEKILSREGKAIGLRVNNADIFSDIVLSGADYQHTESLLSHDLRFYSQQYWNKRTFAPSALVFYVGFDTKLINVRHHTLFFDADFDEHARAIYDHATWPDRPLFYASFASKTDSQAAPSGKEAAVFLVPLAPDLEDSEDLRNKIFEKIIVRLRENTGQEVEKHILFKRSFGIADFKKDYNSFKGNAYGLANTLTQTAFLRPGIKSRKIDNLYFTGQLTVPGPGVPPALISGKIASELIRKKYQEVKEYESSF